jgi:hypothetical protein
MTRRPSEHLERTAMAPRGAAVGATTGSVSRHKRPRRVQGIELPIATDGRMRDSRRFSAPV